MAKKQIVDKAQEVAKSLKRNADKLADVKANEMCVYSYYNTVTKHYTPNLLVLPKATENHHAMFFERHLYDMFVAENKKFPIDLEIHQVGFWNLAKCRFVDVSSVRLLLKLKDVYAKFEQVKKG